MKLLQTLSFCLLFILLGGLSAKAEEALDPYRLFRDHYEAMGGLERLKQIRTTYAEGRTRYDGLAGTFRSWSEKPLRYRLDEDFGIIRQSEGDDGKTGWRLDTNGQVEELRDEETLKRRKISELLENFAHLDPASPYLQLNYEGRTELDGITCHVVRMSNRINSDVSRFFFAVDSLRVLQTIDQQPDIEVRTRYDDYRQVDGLWFPFHQDARILPRNKRQELFISRQQLNPKVDPTGFAVPLPTTGEVRYPEKDRAENISFRFIENLIYLPVTIGNDTRPWILDSGASMSVIDADYARRLGLTPQGSIGGFGFGELFELAFVKLPSLRVGTLGLPEQTIHAFQGLSAGSYEPVRAGILGYDFLSRFVTRIDYARQTVSFYRPESFRYQGPGMMIDAPLKYRTFSIPAGLDDMPTARFSLDLGSHRSSLYYPYAESHGLLNRPGVDTVSLGMSGYSFERLTPFKTLNIAGLTITRPLLTIPDAAGRGTSSVGELAGALGNSLLRNFVIYLDYSRQQVIIERGAEFNHPVAEDKSGILVGMSETGQPMISFVAADTPAQAAGFIPGDLIEKIDGRPAADYGGVIPIRKLLREKAGTKYQFTIHRETHEMDIILELRELLR